MKKKKCTIEHKTMFDNTRVFSHPGMWNSARNRTHIANICCYIVDTNTRRGE